jgi:nucleotide-binding universal stress UspA family protein
VAEKVLRASPVPVLVVRSFPAPAEKALSRGRLEALPLRHILIPTDGSERSLGIVGWIREFAHPIDARVVLLHVIEDPMAGEGWRGPAEPVKQAERGLLEAGIPVTTAYRRGDPAIEILAACEEHSIDLLAMSTHGRSGPSRWAFGSVTEKVLRASNLPMLVARVRARGPSVGPEVGSALQIKL